MAHSFPFNCPSSTGYIHMCSTPPRAVLAGHGPRGTQYFATINDPESDRNSRTGLFNDEIMPPQPRTSLNPDAVARACLCASIGMPPPPLKWPSHPPPFHRTNHTLLFLSDPLVLPSPTVKIDS